MLYLIEHQMIGSLISGIFFKLMKHMQWIKAPILRPYREILNSRKHYGKMTMVILHTYFKSPISESPRLRDPPTPSLRPTISDTAYLWCCLIKAAATGYQA